VAGFYGVIRWFAAFTWELFFLFSIMDWIYPWVTVSLDRKINV
jgi:hypothetical protein